MIPMMDFSGRHQPIGVPSVPLLDEPHQDTGGEVAGEVKGVLSLIYYSWLMHWGESGRRDDASAEHTHRSGPRVYYVGQRDYEQSER